MTTVCLSTTRCEEVEVASHPRDAVGRCRSRQCNGRAGGDRREVQEALRQHRFALVELELARERLKLLAVRRQQPRLEAFCDRQGGGAFLLAVKERAQVLLEQVHDRAGEFLAVLPADIGRAAAQLDDRGGEELSGRRRGRGMRGRQRERLRLRPDFADTTRDGNDQTDCET